MNQILITEKLYITPELKKKKKLYKFEFFLSIFIVCVLISAYIYAEYDRSKSEEVAQEILNNIEVGEVDNTVIPEDALVIVLDEDASSEEIIEENMTPSNALEEKKVTLQGTTYTTVATINIPKINVN